MGIGYNLKLGKKIIQKSYLLIKRKYILFGRVNLWWGELMSWFWVEVIVFNCWKKNNV